MKKYVFISFNVLKTLQLGALLASVCIENCIIFLNGKIGTGKSVFCRGFLYYLGYIGVVKSPTYTLMESYFLNKWHVYHFDFYRLKSFEEVEHVGIYECLYDGAICLIEWPVSNLQDILKADISITINYLQSSLCREIIIEAFSDLGNRMLVSLLRYVEHDKNNQE